MSDTNSTPTPETPDTPQPTPTTPSEQITGGFTQADVDRIIADRLKRDREAQETKLKERYGVSDLSEVEALIKAKREADEAALSETQKLQAQIDALTRKAQEAEQRAKETENKYLNEQRRSVFENALTASGSTNAKRVYTLLQLDKPNDFASVFGDDATPDDNKLKSLIKQVQADYPEYFGNPGAGSPSNGNGVAPNSQNTDDIQKQLKKRFGKL